jgi:hypothetical protein
MNKKLATNKLKKDEFSGKKSGLRVVKQNDYIVLDESVGGDAPKDVIRLYTFGKKTKKNNTKTWKKYIAKLGHKLYPTESITEHLITIVGKCLNFNIANSKILVVDGKVRFLSEHFLNEDERLDHGAEIISRYLNEPNTKLLDTIENQRQTRDFFDIEDIIQAIKSVYSGYQNEIIKGFVKLLVFDAITGNNDRHFYNWGVVNHVKGTNAPYFSPIYDSARALWWNTEENEIIKIVKDFTAYKTKFDSYISNKSKPKIGVPSNKNANHFELIDYLNNKNFIDNETKYYICSVLNIDELQKSIYSEFNKVLSKDRIWLINQTLASRINILISILKKD